MRILDNPSRLLSFKAKNGLKITKKNVVSHYIRQVKLEKAIRKYVTEKKGDEGLIIDLCGMIRDYSNSDLEQSFNLYEEGGIVYAMARHLHKRKSLIQELLSL